MPWGRTFVLIFCPNCKKMETERNVSFKEESKDSWKWICEHCGHEVNYAYPKDKEEIVSNLFEKAKRYELMQNEFDVRNTCKRIIQLDANSEKKAEFFILESYLIGYYRKNKKDFVETLKYCDYLIKKYPNEARPFEVKRYIQNSPSSLRGADEEMKKKLQKA